jgi:transcriptional regulator CtsR
MEYTCNVSQRKSKSKSKMKNDKKRQNMGHLRPVPNVSRKEKIMRMSDIIEDFIKELLEEQDEAIEIQRNELAEHFNCVPSQINYVISTRFKPSQGYYVESKRGGGGHITIKKVNNSKEDYIMHIINNVGKELTANEVDILISDFLSYDIINKKEARLLKVATSDNVLQLQKDLKDKVRARIFKNMLLNLE